MKAKKLPIIEYVCLAIMFAIACGYQARATIYSFADYLHIQAVGWPFFPEYSHGQPHLAFVGAAAQQAGVKENDILVSVNGHPLTGLTVFGEAMRQSKPGDVLTATVSSPGESSVHSASIPLEQRRSPRLVWAAAFLVCVKFVIPAFCLLLGFWVVAARPRDRSAWLLFLTLQFFSVYYGAGIESWGQGIRDLAQVYHVGLATAWPIFMLLFGIYFPEPITGKYEALWKWAKRILIPALTLISIASVIENVGELENFASVASLAAALERISKLSFLLSFAATGSFFACIGMKLGLATTPDAKRRLRLLQWGTTISMTPACILFVVQAIKGGQFEKIFPIWLVLISLALMLLFPVTLAYAIVVHRALDVRVVIRQGLQYALATGGIRALQIVLTAVVLIAGIAFARSRHLSLANEITTVALLFLAVLSLRRGAAKVRAWTDRRFFRDAYNSEQILASLGDEVRSIVETRPLLERVATKIAESLHVPRVSVFLQQDNLFRPAYALGYEGVPLMEFQAADRTIQRLREEAEPTRVYFDDERSWVNTDLPADERQKLASLGPQLLLPLSVKDKLLGLVSLGEKRSEAPYSGTDLRLLKSVAVQTALALSNAQLTSAIAQEIAGREKLNREIEIAREVQERLFPQRLPEISGLDYFGRCRTALGVGGDYYDFLALPEGKLGVALGDVSGKGIAAALTMASLQASLRADAVRAGDDIASLIARVNTMVYDASTEDRYATLFYAQFDPATRHLSYVNAGHCPPILLHSAASGGIVERLDEAGGTVVGLLPECAYKQADISLAPGDLLVIYTDGFSEAMNPELEEWGEKRLLEAITSCGGICAKETIAHVMQAADGFAAGAPQSDDMTLVILRVL
jgi:sigma-B regulation protein RsbU (phosphoserine phosphatase)